MRNNFALYGCISGRGDLQEGIETLPINLIYHFI